MTNSGTGKGQTQTYTLALPHTSLMISSVGAGLFASAFFSLQNGVQWYLVEDNRSSAYDDRYRVSTKQTLAATVW